jgi:hypothetical protein
MPLHTPRDIELYINRNIGHSKNITEKDENSIKEYNKHNYDNITRYLSCSEIDKGHYNMTNQICSKLKYDAFVIIRCTICGFIQVDI